MNFEDRYNKLNEAQKQAVETVEGPVMIIAGPGTGKTELLAMRAANIINKTDTLPENILCLTFTEVGASNMRKRLIEIIGQQAYKIAIHTFHGFGTEVINQNKEYFYNGATFSPADEIKNYEIIRNLFEKLGHKSLIKGKSNEEFIYLKDCLKVISEIKRSGLTPEELSAILDQNDRIVELFEPLIQKIFIGRPNKDTINQAIQLNQDIQQIEVEGGLFGKTSLGEMIKQSFNRAIEDTTNLAKPSTKCLTAWRNQWLEKDRFNNQVFKAKKKQLKLRQALDIYQQYLIETAKQEIFDFDDMILHVIRAMEDNDDLKFNLQEQFQYIMVDEFQDTNGAQMRILENLADNIVNEGQPNIMVVGDDDQAIYSFQGAELSNILDFTKLYPKTKLITLNENYRSGKNILDSSYSLINQGINRLENKLDNISKALKSNQKEDGIIKLYQAGDITNERYWLAKDIKSLITDGIKPEDIAVLVRRNEEVKQIVPYLEQQGIEVNYAKQTDALEQDIIVLIEKICQCLIHLADNQQDLVDAALPAILSHPVWQIKPTRLWQLSLEAYQQSKKWLCIMEESQDLKPISEWLIELASLIDKPLEIILDVIIGKKDAQKINLDSDFISPIYDYFFSQTKLDKQANEYLLYLEAIRTIRDKTRQYYNDKTPDLRDFINFIQLSRKVDSTINLIDPDSEVTGKVKVMNVHKAKGLEFEVVYIANAVDSNWGRSARKPNRLIQYPDNLKLSPAGSDDDERLRLFYVAMTRAKQQLKISYSQKSLNDKELFIVDILSGSNLKINKIKPLDMAETIQAKETDWYQPVINLPEKDIKKLLEPVMARYKLSITHLQKFLDVKNGGPQAFLMNNILRFPQAKAPTACYGTAIHEALQFRHNYFKQNNQPPDDKLVVDKFIQVLGKQHLSQTDFELMKNRGQDNLVCYLENGSEKLSSNQQVEVSFSNQDCLIEEAHLTGKLDLIEIDPIEKCLTITDYKTGEALFDWSSKDPYQKIKLHQYHQQLMFYKLLVDNSRDYSKYQVTKGIMQFVEPDDNNQLAKLELDFSEQDMDDFIKLVQAVWQKITSLDLPDISNFDKSLKGIIDFEKSLVDNK